MAATDARRIIKNAAYRATFSLVNSAGQVVSGATTPDSEISKDGATFTDCTNEATELATSSGVYYLELTATEMSADQIAVIIKSGTANTRALILEPEPCLDSGVAAAGATSAITLASTASANDDQYNGSPIEIVRGTGAGQIRTITDYDGSGLVATVDRDWVTTPGSDSVYIIHPRIHSSVDTSGRCHSNIQSIKDNDDAATLMEAMYQGAAVASSISDAGPTTTSFKGASGLSSSDDFYNGCRLIFTSGTMKGIEEKINDYTGATRLFTFASAFPATPTNGDEFVIIGRVY